jgi:hypothetical protein
MRRSIVAFMLAMLATSSFVFISSQTNADTQAQSLWIRMRGGITQWGDEQVFGFIGANARIVNANGTHHEWARVHAIWSEEPHRLNCTEPPRENFTFVLYAARLVNTTYVKLNYSGYDLYISGLWNVIKITTTIFVDQNGKPLNVTRIFEPIVTGGEGELHVLARWHLFELSINGIPLLRGFVRDALIRFVEIRIYDVNDDGKVDLRDLVKVARRYNTVPGLFNYDHDMDLNEDNKIDIGDLTTIAANIKG